MIMVTSSSTVPVLWDTQNPYKTFYLVLNNHTFLQLVESNCKCNIFLCHLHLHNMIHNTFLTPKLDKCLFLETINK